jgi:hypothetical protein
VESGVRDGTGDSVLGEFLAKSKEVLFFGVDLKGGGRGLGRRVCVNPEGKAFGCEERPRVGETVM